MPVFTTVVAALQLASERHFRELQSNTSARKKAITKPLEASKTHRIIDSDPVGFT